jgi:predicted MFS family arabinose efflux permease
MITVEGRTPLITGSSCLGMLAVGANGTAIMAALPTIRRDLALDAGEVVWAVNAYLIASATCIILGGKTADRTGARGAAACGLLLFTLASAVIATAEAAPWLLGGRALQGLGAAFAVPGTLAAIGTASAPDRRASAIGAWAGFLMLGFSLGPLIGGALTHYLGWRAVFWCTGLAVLAAAGGLGMAGPVTGGTKPDTTQSFDWVGFLLLATAMVSVTLALHGVATARSEPLAFAAPLMLAGASFALFARTERHRRDPLVDPGLLRSPAFLRAVAVGALSMSCILPLLLYLNLEAQSPGGLALSAVGAGVLLLPMSAGLLAAALLAPHLIRRFGPRRGLTGAMLLIVGAGPVIAIAVAERALVPLAGGLLVIGAGLALPYAAAPRLALATLPLDQAGQGSGIVNACTFLGGSIGVTCGALAHAQGGLPAVMAFLAGAALLGAAVCRRMPAIETA